MSLPRHVPLSFRGWVPWDEIFTSNGAWGDPPAHGPFTASELSRVGVYLLAHADASPSASPDPADPAVFYIGETHGSVTSVWGRLRDFGRSAGLFGAAADGHYAGWWYPWRFLEQRPFDAMRTDSSQILVAIQTYDFVEGPADAKGAFPLLIEGAAMWEHVIARGTLPKLNNKGRARTTGAGNLGPLPEAAIAALMKGPGQGTRAASYLAQLMAIRCGAKPWLAEAWTESHDDGWTGAVAQPHKQESYGLFYVGWDAAGVPNFRAGSPGAWWVDSLAGRVGRTEHTNVVGELAAASSEIWRLWWA